MQSYLQHTQQKKDSQTFNPSFCFRLDKDTSGLIISAKTYTALQLLNELIRDRKTRKTYLAIVIGEFKGLRTITKPLFIGFDKKSGKARTFVNEEKGKESETKMMGIATYNDKVL